MDTFFIKYNGFVYAVLHLCDAFTKWSMFYVCEGAMPTGAETIAALSKWKSIWGSPPEVVFSDGGSEFINSKMFYFCISENVVHLRSV